MREGAWAACARALLGTALLIAASAARAASFEAVAPGAFVLHEADLAATAAPHGEAGNVGLVAGRDAAVLIDTGASSRQGRVVLAAVRGATAAPVSFALISHALPEFLFGASVLQEAGIPLLAQRDTATLIAQRCALCLERFRKTYGEEAMAGSRVPVPDRVLKGDLAVDLGGREARILDFGWASTPGDLAVLDEANGVLFAGGLVVVGRVPAVRDAQVTAWIAALDRITTMPLKRVVPGHGPVAEVAEVAALRGYLATLDAEVRRRYAAGAGLAETVATLRLPAYEGWRDYAELHRRNVQDLYLAIERAELNGAAPSVAGGSD